MSMGKRTWGEGGGHCPHTRVKSTSSIIDASAYVLARGRAAVIDFCMQVTRTRVRVSIDALSPPQNGRPNHMRKQPSAYT